MGEERERDWKNERKPDRGRVLERTKCRKSIWELERGEKKPESN